MQFLNLVKKHSNSLQQFKAQLISKITNPQAKRYIQQKVLSSLNGPYAHSNDFGKNQFKSSRTSNQRQLLQLNYYDLSYSLKKIQTNIVNKISKYNVEMKILKSKCESIQEQINRKKNDNFRINVQQELPVHKHQAQSLKTQIINAEKNLANLKNQTVKAQIMCCPISLEQQLKNQKQKYKNLVQTLNHIQHYSQFQKNKIATKRQSQLQKLNRIKILQGKMQEFQLFNNKQKLQNEVNFLQEKVNVNIKKLLRSDKYQQLQNKKKKLQRQLEEQLENKKQFSQQLVSFMQNFKKQKLKNKRLLEQIANINQKQFPFYDKIFQINFFSGDEIKTLMQKGMTKEQISTALTQIKIKIRNKQN